MIVRCPNCKREFILKYNPPQTFVCPKCSFTSSFKAVMEGTIDKISNSVTNPDGQSATVSDDATVVISGLGGSQRASSDIGEKTKLVQDLQPKKRVGLMWSFNGSGMSRISLPDTGNFSLGRNSSDSTAQIKISPDYTMSRVHAGMRVVMDKNGNKIYQITSVKNENPVYVNNKAISKGMPCVLKAGDIIRMGNTTMKFILI